MLQFVTLSSLHVALSLLAVASTVALALVAAFSASTREIRRVLIDRLVLAALAATAVAAVVGLLAVAGGTPPGDPLHLVYGVAALLVLPVGRFLARAGEPRRRALIVTVAAVAELAIYARLWMTGA